MILVEGLDGKCWHRSRVSAELWPLRRLPASGSVSLTICSDDQRNGPAPAQALNGNKAVEVPDPSTN